MLSDTWVSNISSLKGLEALETLFLSNTRIADINPLKGLTSLKTLDLRYTYVEDIFLSQRTPC
ncbi:MAG: leucine-rich repeat domain-containing protein [Bacteroidetes bacterium]|nr:leucine-rich repeat domain-containing protein [Bacteroidota bacterium]